MNHHYERYTYRMVEDPRHENGERYQHEQEREEGEAGSTEPQV